VAGLNLRRINRSVSITEVGGVKEFTQVARDVELAVVCRIDRRRLQRTATADVATLPGGRHLSRQNPGHREQAEQGKTDDGGSVHGWLTGLLVGKLR